MRKQYYVYLATNKWNTTLYVGMTNDLQRRITEHKTKAIQGFTSRYNINKLVYYEVFDRPEEVIMAEKKLKGGSRQKKLDLIKDKNPIFRDLAEEIASLCSQ